MGAIADALKSVINRRQEQLPLIDLEITSWREIRQEISGLEGALAGLDVEQQATLSLSMPTADMAQAAAEAVSALEVVRGRVGRSTVNIGVGGAARNGKSTLLQSFTGLGDDQIPTGSGLPVTAVRSRIFNTSGSGQALLTMHSERSFLENVVAPYHEALSLGAPPTTIDAFALLRYPQSEDELSSDARAGIGQTGPMRQRLLLMQGALPTYRDLLTGGTRTESLVGLRRWVAYPSAEESATSSRHYLAVREARIEYPFPEEDTDLLGCIDLPGLGEIEPNAERQHIRGLSDEVDVVLLVKRPMAGNAFWDKKDGEAVTLLNEAAGAAGLRDFMLLVINVGGCAPGDIEALRHDVLARVNEGIDGRRINVIETDVKDAELARSQILHPALRHLAARLGAMDASVIESARQLCEAKRAAILAPTRSALDQLRQFPIPTQTEELVARADELRIHAARSLNLLLVELEQECSGTGDPEYVAEVEAAYSAVRDWVVDGFEEGEQSWCARAVDRMRVDAGWGPYVTYELNRVRIEIGRRFGVLDAYFNRRHQAFLGRVCSALGEGILPVMDAATPAETLSRLARLFADAPDPCPTLATAVDEVLDMRIDYRSQAFPQLLQAFTLLRAESKDPTSGSEFAGLTLDEAGAKDLYERIQALARQVVYRAQGVLLDEGAAAPRVLLAFAQQFEDSLIRSGRSEAEFRRFVAAYRDELWPGEFAQGGLASSAVQAVRTALSALETTLGETTTIVDVTRQEASV